MVSSTMLVAYLIIQVRLQTPLNTGTTLLELSLLATLLPVTCLLVYAFPDNGVNSKSMFLYALVVVLFMVWAQLIVSHFHAGGFESWSEGILFTVRDFSKLPFVLVLYSLCLLGLTAILVLVYNRSIDVVVYSAILLASSTFTFFDVQYISSTMFSLSGTLIIIYVMSASHDMAFNDQLTNIPGRHALEVDMKHLGRKYSMAMVDIDHFKTFNDTYGHDIGDDVLKLVARLITETGGGARAYRYGGEEFTIIFKGKYADQVKADLQALISDIQNYDMIIRNTHERPDDHEVGMKKRGQSSNPTEVVNVTVSIGVSDSTTTKHPEEVLKLADNALYKAKETGRNKLIVSN
ncbi:GGDEF domain-containing protein [Vibrio cyclitrophicus]|uniref:diguanylate cyclase n=2 Tax=Vibrio cyclitrophicus TaxID=47951 RepID=A0A7Z1MIV5_9VIBR|nr:GGDEF domain protein [Vibrio cyclitrophicus FF75]KNH12190.1 diguanylate cyclase [Vibrio lentus]NOH21202.1 GGDEF domain-containing protein [Vibrio cyclitrophicus]OED79797.1 diguanylate cyclase [Vibrio cyclitrophicus ZF65]OED89212.1 diguanylate cyclase [Vibrio cyclitrophicus ZF30]OED99433.1 diguanylate cyclase [Vibrio cyclitrophicus ZF28]OEE00057.1 diguanylate cyclase [Vibrio cyclitrophicus ZF264]OEE02904.1 diguanylate cyclase [Vibrio cyclitrophicus ZF270]OEE11616.1 diguanylate cyclase [Vi